MVKLIQNGMYLVDGKPVETNDMPKEEAEALKKQIKSFAQTDIIREQ